MKCFNALVKPDKYKLLMHQEYFVKKKGKAERHKKENRPKNTPGNVNHKKMEGNDGELCP